MMFLSPRPDGFFRLSGSLALLSFVAGCASPGTPRAPSLHLPLRVKSLSAERHGALVTLRFSTPDRTTDDQPITVTVLAGLCRAPSDGPCRPTASFPAKTKISGPVEWVDALPPALATGDPRRLTYRVELFNPEGRSAGWSEPAFTAAGQAPGPVEALKAEGSAAGIVLRWTPEAQSTGEVLVKREDLNSPAPKTAPGKKTATASRGVGERKPHRAVPAKTRMGSSKDESVVWLHAADTAPDHDTGGLVDATAKTGEPYRYTAVRTRTVMLDSHKVEMRSEPSHAATITLLDVFPPAVPQGLVAAGFPVEGTENLAADLVWQPDTESDLVGYNVYRQALKEDGSATGTAGKLNPKPLALPSFHDATVARGVGYRYTVTAVDSRGNESAASAPADLAAIP